MGLSPDGARRRPLDRAEIALRWFAEEYVPVVEILREAELIGRRETETDAICGCPRPLPAHAHAHWSDEAIERVRRGR